MDQLLPVKLLEPGVLFDLFRTVMAQTFGRVFCQQLLQKVLEFRRKLLLSRKYLG